MTASAEDDVLVNVGETVGATLGKIVAGAHKAVAAARTMEKKGARAVKKAKKSVSRTAGKGKGKMKSAVKRGKKLVKKAKRKTKKR